MGGQKPAIFAQVVHFYPDAAGHFAVGGNINARPRKIIKTRGHFPSDDAATNLIWLALKNITTDWNRSPREWTEALNQFAIAYGDRCTTRLG